MARTRLRVFGTVQGVGFRPFVYRHATALGLCGSVRNDSAGVVIDLEGDPDSIAELARLVRDQPPPLAHVTSVVEDDGLGPDDGAGDGFRILDSLAGGPTAAAVSVDTATCDACLAEVADPADRRYRYPFTNCTSCGPRYTIVQAVPYDRAATTMAAFAMCDRCQAEYDDPGDRRFHAQPNACPECGPRLAWSGGDVGPARGEAALAAAVDALRAGAVIAVKGIGGYHLAADATDPAAVARLRQRKARDDKPFAVMVRDIEEAHRCSVLTDAAVAALTSPWRPIVLAPSQPDAPVVDAVAPGLAELGLLLPYTPLHHLLLEGVARPLVMTSGNLSDEPIAHDDDDARARLAALVDGFLGHDRPIHIRCDDSVVRASPRRLQLLRRSRGYAPAPRPLPFVATAPVLALGAELKSTIALAHGSEVVASHHLGDLEHLATYRAFLQAVDHLPALCGVRPEVLAHDLHPEYLSTKLAAEVDLPAVAVQHHHAHVAACLVEHGRTSPVLGVVFDGLGLGPDGTLWGGELLAADLGGFERLGHLLPAPLPGGAAANREPWRMAATWLALARGPDAVAAALPDVPDGARDPVLALTAPGRAPTTTSVGRLFDAAAALLGGRRRVTYEAQAAIELEALARTVRREDAPRYEGTVVVDDGAGLPRLDPRRLLERVADEHAAGAPVALVAAGFHEAFGAATAELATSVARAHGLETVVLTGGVFQNARLTEVVEDALADRGLEVLVPCAVPPNDGGISVGQAAVVAWSLGERARGLKRGKSG